MKKLLLLGLPLLMGLSANARPVRPGQWTTAKLSDGTTINVELVGDEHMHYYRSAEGDAFQLDPATGIFSKIGQDEVSARRTRAAARRNRVVSRQQQTRRRMASLRRDESTNPLIGEQRGLVILVDFQDVKFQKGHDVALFNDILNKENYTDNGFKGSARDYFREQSGGKFTLDFDVVGTCTLKNKEAYYSANGDENAVEMIVEACNWAHEQGVDFSKYDWDGDGYVDQVFVVFAGPGYSSQNPTAICPYMYYLSEEGYKDFKLDGVTLDTYACSCEMYNSSRISGIGSFCHEFSHCMGFPDMYDENGVWEGMGYYDLMDVGLYNGEEFCPAGYSAYEKSECGWFELEDMSDITTKVSVEMQPLNKGGKAYVIYNRGLYDNEDKDECYIIEYRAQNGTDAYLPTTGVMITHVDYDYDVWDNMVQNTSNASYWAYDWDANKWVAAVNDHQRIQLVHCDNSTSLYDASYNNNHVLYPSITNKSLSKTSKPAATLYNENEDGTNYLQVAINNITLHPQEMTATMDFVPNGYKDPVDPGDPGTPDEGDAVFYESFDKCAGTGGNDGVWTTPEQYPSAVTDKDGWTASSGSYLRAADKCLWFEGAKRKGGTLTSPEFAVDGTVTLQFKAGALTGSGTNLTLSVEGGTADKTELTMESGKWTTYTVKIEAHGTVKIALTNNKGSFLLDEVRVTGNGSTGVAGITAGDKQTVGFYTVGGVRLNAPQKGVNIVRLADGTTRKVIF